jgi:CspA family cold shock protein
MSGSRINEATPVTLCADSAARALVERFSRADTWAPRIQFNDPATEILERRSRMARGTVKWFNSQKGYGFMQPQGGGKDVFVHISAVEKAGLNGLNEGQVVEYEEVANKGKTSAENLKVLTLRVPLERS